MYAMHSVHAVFARRGDPAALLTLSASTNDGMDMQEIASITKPSSLVI